MAKKSSKTVTETKTALPVLPIAEQYEALNAKIAKAQAIYRMIGEVYGRESDMWKMAWKSYQDLQDQAHVLSLQMENNSPV